MRTNSNTPKILSLIAIVGLAATNAAAQLGPLTPPAGPPADTGPDLEQIDDAINDALDQILGEPIALPTVPGDASAVHVITQPGDYVLPDDLVVPPGMDGIRVEADCVRIRLNGHAIMDPANAADAAIRVLLGNPLVLPNPVGVEIEDGTIKGFQRGVEADDEWERVRIEQMKFLEQAQEAIRALGENSEVEGAEIFDSGGNGITGGNGLKVNDTDIVRPGGDGVNAGDGANLKAIRIRDAGGNAVDAGNDLDIGEALFQQALQDAVRTLDRAVVKDVKIAGAVGAGVVTGNDTECFKLVIKGTGGPAYQGGVGNEIEDSHIAGSAGGYQVGADSRATNTAIRDIAAGPAFQAGPNSSAVDCTVQAADVGYQYDAASRLLRVRAFDVNDAGIEAGPDSTVVECDVKFVNNPGAAGIRVFDNSLIQDCNVLGVNSGLAYDSAGPNIRVIGNTATNSNIGVQMVPGSFYFRNQAYGNGINYIVDPLAAFGPVIPINGVGNLNAIPATQHPQANFED